MSEDRNSDSAPRGTLPDRQQSIYERFQRLESTMLKLTKLLARTEPEKAERVRDALDLAGKQRIKTRIEALVTLLRRDVSKADGEQEKLLADLDGLLQVLTNPANELDSRRAERQKLEQLKRAIRELMDEEQQHMYRTQHLEQRIEPAQGESGQRASPETAEMLRKIEQMQRETQRKAADVGRGLRGKPGETEAQKERPGGEQMEKAADQMRQAADKLGETKPGPAKEHQKESLEEMQKALDELDDALRQVRKEEMEETLAAMEARLQQMLQREKEVRERVVELQGKDLSSLARTEELLLTETAQAQREVADDAGAALRILVDEGTTVIVPELLRQMSTDMQHVAERLARSDVSPDTKRILDDIIAQLEEMLAAVEKKRDENQKQDDAPQMDAPQQDGPEPLLPRSAELKLLRSSQLRLVERMPDDLLPAGDDPAETHARVGDERDETARKLGERQRQLADLTRRMNERK